MALAIAFVDTILVYEINTMARIVAGAANLLFFGWILSTSCVKYPIQRTQWYQLTFAARPAVYPFALYSLLWTAAGFGILWESTENSFCIYGMTYSALYILSMVPMMYYCLLKDSAFWREIGNVRDTDPEKQPLNGVNSMN